MKVNAWMQMGVERRETVIEIPDEEIRQVLHKVEGLETALDRYVLEWLMCQYGWGWSGAGMVNDFTAMEGDDELSGWVVIRDSAMPNTKHFRMGKEVPRTPKRAGN